MNQQKHKFQTETIIDKNSRENTVTFWIYKHTSNATEYIYNYKNIPRENIYIKIQVYPDY